MKFKQECFNLLLGSLLLTGLIACHDKSSKVNGNSEKLAVMDSVNHGYNELANSDNRKSFAVSDFNTDNQEIKNIDRPSVSAINTKLDTALLFGIWTSDPNGPHADFDLTRKSFFVVDYDGNGDMPYELINNRLKIYYNDLILEGDIMSIDKDTLKIKWKGFDKVNSFVRWPQ